MNRKFLSSTLHILSKIEKLIRLWKSFDSQLIPKETKKQIEFPQATRCFIGGVCSTSLFFWDTICGDVN